LNGNTLLDFAGGIGLANVGHSPAAVVNAARKQMERFIHTCAIVTTYEPVVELAELLHQVTPGDFPKNAVFQLRIGSGGKCGQYSPLLHAAACHYRF
jgi:4-aminobutyrate aminotransferase/(S)-3-amino-2-methylpropionate transaminase